MGGLVQVVVEPRLEDLLLAEPADDNDPGHGGGDVVDHRRLHDVVQLLRLQHARVHREVQQDECHKDEGKSNKEVGEQDTDQNDLRKFSENTSGMIDYL